MIHVETTCESFIKTEQKQKNVSKYVDFKAMEPGGKVYLSKYHRVQKVMRSKILATFCG